jgi:probable phosphoglycerate mutase
VKETKLVIARHGETQWNAEQRFQGFSDSPLTAAGEAQAEALGERLAREHFDAVYCSDLGRVRQTVAPFLARSGLEASFDAALRERCYGALEGKTLPELQREFPDDLARYRGRDPHAVPPGGESTAQFHERIIAALERIANENAGRSIAVIAHGGVLGALYRHVNGLALDAPRNHSLANASINRFVYHRERWLLELWGDISHLSGLILNDL